MDIANITFYGRQNHLKVSPSRGHPHVFQHKPSQMSSAPTPSSSRLSLAELCSPSPTTPTMTTASTSTRQASAPRHDDPPRDTHYGAERPSSLTEEEESVMIAVLVLDDMRSRAVSSSSSSQEYRYSTCKAFSHSFAEARSDTHGDTTLRRALH